MAIYIYLGLLEHRVAQPVLVVGTCAQTLLRLRPYIPLGCVRGFPKSGDTNMDANPFWQEIPSRTTVQGNSHMFFHRIGVALAPCGLFGSFQNLVAKSWSNLNVHEENAEKAPGIR